MSTVSPMDAREALASSASTLLGERLPAGWWQGELSTSALSTATAVMALQLATESDEFADQHQSYQQLITGGIQWLVDHQNKDGGWGDTVLSVSNISTSMLVLAVFHRTGQQAVHEKAVTTCQQYVDAAGGVDAVIKRYGKDHTFSVPILTHCALAGIVDWKRVIPLPFELSCVPARFYAAVRMPVVSYALPALIAIGQVIFHKRGHWNPLVRWIRRGAIKRSLKVLESIQPENGGFLEATPLTSFVCMSLLGCGYRNSPVIHRCLQFIEASVRPDGSWPIDTSLTTWVTTLSVNALAGDAHNTTTMGIRDYLSEQDAEHIRGWLLKQQYKDVHPYTNSPPGGWSWIDQPGGVPDSDDTPGAMLAVMNLRAPQDSFRPEEVESLNSAATWLLNLQNRDGGWPTFCRGWGTLPFDRSSNDLTAHVMRALVMWQARVADVPDSLSTRAEIALNRGFRYLQIHQAEDGSWLPLWFGNQFNTNDENPLYGTAKVLLALKECGHRQTEAATRACDWLIEQQNSDGSWSARQGLTGSVEETGLAVEALAGFDGQAVTAAVAGGVRWLSDRVQHGTHTEPSPIGFYFAKLWYFEKLYPIIFCVAGLRRALQSKETGG
ncbi:MAG: squalene--hopene cyclase [Planctomycetaceae bacterium]|nr:squalene--hopene cyclase [Planctomycetaceae bacterium]